MSGSYNSVTLVGNLGKDPEVREISDDRKVVTFSMATSEQWRDKNSGERRERTEWHRVVIFNQHLGKIAGEYLKKGAKVLIVGALQSRKWTDQGGVERYTTEVVLSDYNGTLTMLGAKGGREEPPPQDDPREVPEEPTAKSDLDDEIPF